MEETRRHALTSELTLASKLTLASELALASKLALASELTLASELALACEPALASELTLASKLALACEPALASELGESIVGAADGGGVRGGVAVWVAECMWSVSVSLCMAAVRMWSVCIRSVYISVCMAAVCMAARMRLIDLWSVACVCSSPSCISNHSAFRWPTAPLSTAPLSTAPPFTAPRGLLP